MLARVLAIALCLSVCLCLLQVGVLLKGMDGLVFDMGVSSTKHKLCYKEIHLSTKIVNS